MSRFSDIEVATFHGDIAVAAADLNGSVGFTGGQDFNFEGHLLLDYDEFVDRNEELRLLRAQHRLVVYQNSTTTEDGTVRGMVEISASPARSMSFDLQGGTAQGDVDSGVAGGEATSDDSIDVIGRPMVALAFSPFSDTTNGTGGAGAQGDDQVTVEAPPAEMGRFHPRDELFLNGRLTQWNIADAGIHLDVIGQHMYGVMG